VKTISLNPLELQICLLIAEERQNTNEANRVTDRKISDKPALDLHYQGLTGEFVVAKYLNVYPDFTTQSRHGGSELIFRGWKVDAKNVNPHTNLMTPTHKKLEDADIYVVVTGDNPYYILGWCFAGELINHRNIVYFTPVESYLLRKENFREPEALKRLAERR